MRPSFELFLSLRHLKSKKKERFISVATFICLLGVSLGVMALIVVLSVMNGFQEAIKEKILALSAHVLVLNYQGAFLPEEPIQRLKGLKEVSSLSPMVLTQLMVSSDYASSGAVLRGIRREGPDFLYLRGKLLEGQPELKTGEVWIGVELAKILGVRVGDRLRLISPLGRFHPFGTIPRVKDVVISGIFQAGMYDYDVALVLAPLEDVQSFLSLDNRVTHLAIRLKDIYEAHRVSREIQKLLGASFFTRDWMEMNKNLFYALRMERRVMFILLSLIVAVGAFNIIGVLMMTVMEKRREIAILRSMGAQKKTILKIFLYQGLLIGIIGTSIGTLGGIVLSLNISRIANLLEAFFGLKFLPPDVYYISEVPSKLDLTDTIAIVILALSFSLLSSLYPAWKASNLDPVEVLRYE